MFIDLLRISQDAYIKHSTYARTFHAELMKKILRANKMDKGFQVFRDQSHPATTTQMHKHENRGKALLTH